MLSAGELSADAQHGAGGDDGYPEPQAPQPGRPSNVRSTLSGDGVDYFNTLSVEGTVKRSSKITWFTRPEKTQIVRFNRTNPVSLKMKPVWD